MDIWVKEGSTERVLLSVAISQDAVHEEELMKSDFVKLTWESTKRLVLPAGAFIVPFDDNVRYSLLEPYEPDQKDEVQYHYEPQFHHPKMYLGKVTFTRPSKDTDRNDITLLDWSYTGFIGTLLGYFCEQMGSVLGTEFSYALVQPKIGVDDDGNNVYATIDNVVTASFSTQDILSALSNVANLLECEWHIDWDVRILYFGHIMYDEDEPPVLEVGKNVTVPSVRSSKDGFWNAFEPQGGTRNITRRSASGENVQSNVRLALDKTRYPDGIIYTDDEGHITGKVAGKQYFVKSVIFDEIYPKLDLYVYDVRCRERYFLDENNEKVVDYYNGTTPVYKRYAVWYVRLAYQDGGTWHDYDVSDQIIDGKKPIIAFQPNTTDGAQTSPLAGRGDGDGSGHYGFELIYHESDQTIPANKDDGDTGVQIKAGDYEIVFQQNNDYILPTTTSQGIVPKGGATPSTLGNLVSMYNIVLSGTEEGVARGELESATKQYIVNAFKDDNSYTVNSYPEMFEQHLHNPNLFIGKRVILKNGEYELATRVMKLVTKMDYSFEQEITVGNEVLKSGTTTLKEQVQTLISAGSGGGGGGSVSEATIAGLISRYGASRFLSKTSDDEAQGVIGFLKGLWVKAKGLFGIDGDGNASVNGLNALGNASVGGDTTIGGTLFAENGVRTDQVRSTNYTGDGIADTGFLLTNGLSSGIGHSKLTVDELYVRWKAVFESLEVKKWQVSAGDQIYSCAASIISRVDYYADASQAPLGYSYIRVPWLLKGVPYMLSRFSEGLGRKFYASMTKVRRTLTDEQLRRVRFCRCYFLAKDGETEVENWWQVNDLVRCQTMNVVGTTRDTYTSVSRKDGNVAWWRKVVRVSKKPVELEQGKSYHYFDVAFDYEAEQNDTSSVYALYGSDIPAAGDHAVQFGNTVVPGRMNLLAMQVNGGNGLTYDSTTDSPCIKIYKGIYCFDLNKCWFGGSPQKMKLSPSTGYEFYGPEFRIVKEYGVVPVPTQRGAWEDIPLEADDYGRTGIAYADDIISGGTRTRSDGKGTAYVRKCYYYDEVSHKGCTWLCSIADGAHWMAEETFTQGGRTYAAGRTLTDAEYAGLADANKVRCARKPDYTADEPSDQSRDWTKIVDRGTSVKAVTTKYGKGSSGTDHDRVERWVGTEQLASLDIRDGDYFWTWTHTEYSDTLEPTDVYHASRWGIDGDGIASINSYFFGTPDTSLVVNAAKDAELGLLMPSDAGWAKAGAGSKWFDEYGTMAAANGGAGNMQGWNVWQKTVVHYDLPEGRTTAERKPDIINYTMSRIGQDGQTAQEEYYMLAASDDFNAVFGSSAPAKNAIGIVWYNQGAPASERYRLAESTASQSNVNTGDSPKGFAAGTPFWTPYRPAYDKAVHGSRVYLWNFEYRVDGHGTPYATRPVCIGNHARGIMGVRELYALSASGEPQDGHHIPADIYAANGNSETSTAYSDASKPKTWDDEIYNRAPSEALPYQWNWTRTLYSAPRDAGDTQRDPLTGYFFEDRWHVSAVRGTNGEDGAGEESIYIVTDGNPFGGTHPKSVSRGRIGGKGDWVAKADQYEVDDYVPEGWSDNPVGVMADQRFEYVSTRRLGTPDANGRKKWGDFSDPVLRSNWGRNGVDGDGTEYVFIRTRNNVAPVLSSSMAKDSAGRAVADMEYLPMIANATACGAEINGKQGECSDDPKGATREYPYEWVARRTMGSPSTAAADYGHRTWKSYYDCMDGHAMSPWSNYAENSIRLDLDNEMDMVQTNSEGKVTATRTVETVVRFYDGAKEVKLAAGDITAAGASKAASGNGIRLSWTYNAGSTFTGAQITVSYTYAAVGTTYTAVFTIAASKGQPVYQLRPSLSVISFSRTSANALTPSSRTLTLNVEKADGSSTALLAPSASGQTIRYSTDAMPSSATAGTAWPSGNSIPVSSSVTYGNIYIAMFNSAGTLLDRETVPIVKDGMHGENSVRLDLDNENDSMLYTGGGTLVSGSVRSTAYLYDGSEDKSGSTAWTVTPSGCTVSSGNSRNIVVTGMTAASATVTVEGVYKDAHGMTHTKTAVLSLKKIVDGDKYDLIVTPNAIAYNATDDSPATSIVSIQVWKTSVDGSGGAVRSQSLPPGGYGVYAGGKALTASSTGTYSTTIDNSEVSELTVKIAKSATSSEILDLETIPVNKASDGEDGASGATGPYLSAHDTYWCLSGNGVTAPSSGWQTARLVPSSAASEKYLWRRDVYTYDAPERGRNLMTGTARLKTGYSTGNSRANGGVYYSGSGGTVTADTSQELPMSGLSNSLRVTCGSTGAESGFAQGEIALKAGKITMSCWVKGAVGSKVRIQPAWSAYLSSGTASKTFTLESADWQRLEFTGEVTDNTWRIGYVYLSTANATIYIAGLKVEYGDDATDWVLAPEDLNREETSVWAVYGDTPKITIGTNGNWYVDGSDTGVKAEGKDGTGVEIKGSATAATIKSKTGAAVGDCWIGSDDRHLYMWNGSGWSDLGEFKGADGVSSYMHVAWADRITFADDGKTPNGATGFTVVSDGKDHAWIGFCTDNTKEDSTTYGSYKWNYVKGMDGDGYEFVYLRTRAKMDITISTSVNDLDGRKPSDDEYLPTAQNGQAAGAATTTKNGTTRYQFTDDPMGVDETYRYEYESVRKKKDGAWGSFSSPALHSSYAEDGSTPIALYRWYDANTTSVTAPAVTAAQWDAGTLSGWSKTAPNRTADGLRLWMSQNTRHADGSIDAWSTPVWISGEKGDAGEDGKEREWVYRRQDANPGMPSSSGSGTVNGVARAYGNTVDDWVPANWTDNPLGVTENARTEWASWRDFNRQTKTWSTFNPPIIWSHYGERGMDGDGVEYVFFLTKGEDYVPSVVSSGSSGSASSSEYLPGQGKSGGNYNGTRWTDDPTGVSANWPVEWVAQRRKTDGAWGSFGTPAVWSKYAKDGKDGKDGSNGKDGGQGPQGTYEVREYARSSSSTSYSDSYIDASYGWRTSPMLTSVYYPFVWVRSRNYNPATGTYSAYTYVRLTGERGQDGADGKDGKDGSNGRDGSNGKAGRWYDYKGVWGVDVASVTNTANIGYYVRYGNHFYMNTADDGVANTTVPADSAGTANANWEQMDDDRQFYIAKAFFGDYAQFGSGIINGDWIISRHGTVNGSSSTAYTLFDPHFPLGNTGYGYYSPPIVQKTFTASNDIACEFSVATGCGYSISVCACTNGTGNTPMRVYISGVLPSGGTELLKSLSTTSSSDTWLDYELPPGHSYTTIQVRGYRASNPGYIREVRVSPTSNDLFVPNYAIDLLRGSGIFSGSISAARYEYKMYFASDTALSTAGSPSDADYVVASNANNTRITFGNPVDYAGKVITVVNASKRAASNYLILECSNGIVPFAAATGGSQEYKIGFSRMVKMWADGKNGVWRVIEEDLW